MLTHIEQRWVDLLDDEDLAFIKRFLLCSGSLKELAESYDVSYPTLRLRLDRVIQKVQILDNQRIQDPFERVLRAQFADGRMDAETFKKLLHSYNQQKKANE